MHETKKYLVEKNKDLTEKVRALDALEEEHVDVIKILKSMGLVSVTNSDNLSNTKQFLLSRRDTLVKAIAPLLVIKQELEEVLAALRALNTDQVETITVSDMLSKFAPRTDFRCSGCEGCDSCRQGPRYR